MTVGALSDSGDLFQAGRRDPVLSQLSCTGSEDRISECSNNTANIDPSCPAAIAICQGILGSICTVSYIFPICLTDGAF